MGLDIIVVTRIIIGRSWEGLFLMGGNYTTIRGD